MKELFKIKLGDTFKIGPLEFIHLELLPDGTSAVLLKNFWKIGVFDRNTNNYADSQIRKDLNTEFLNVLTKCINEKDIISHEVDLTANDGRTKYGSCIDKISLLTCNLARRYVYLLDKYRNPKTKQEWLATPLGTQLDCGGRSVCFLDFNGSIKSYHCYWGKDFGVRPYCILTSSIMVEE